jgi:hypothetical protein
MDAASVALKVDRTVWAWGRNNEGQLGDGTTTQRNTPVQVSGLTDVAAGVGRRARLAGGDLHSLAAKRNGTVWAWGRNHQGQLGDGTTTNRLTPVQTASIGGSPASITITCPPAASVECPGDTSPASTGQPTTSGGCGTVTTTYADVVTPGCIAGGGAGGTHRIARTFTATDGTTSASCTQTITVVDTTPPVLTPPSDRTVECTESTAPSNTGSASAMDSCDDTPAVSYTDRDAAGDCPQEYVITRTWRAEDACGNVTTRDQVITVVDTTPPVLTLPADRTVECTESTAPSNTGSASALDNCDETPAVSYTDRDAAGDCPQEHVITRTWRSEDACGNVTIGDQVITVVDTTPPLVTLPVDRTVECSESTAPSNTGSTSAIDSCDGTPAVSYTDRDAPGDCPQEHVITRRWRAVDACGNVTTGDQVITVVDTTPPAVIPGSSDLHCLWPPNRQYRCFTQVDFSPTLADNCTLAAAVTWRFVGCQSDQPDDPPGGADDCVVDDDALGFRVRSFRDANVDAGRRYSVTIRATDACGNESAATRVGFVWVPKRANDATGCLRPDCGP